MLLTELELLQALKNYKNVVQYSNDDVRRWKLRITNPIIPCNNGTNPMTFIVMEYIKNGDLETFLKSHLSLQQLKSLFLQTAYVFMELGFIYNVHHGDVN